MKKTQKEKNAKRKQIYQCTLFSPKLAVRHKNTIIGWYQIYWEDDPVYPIGQFDIWSQGRVNKLNLIQPKKETEKLVKIAVEAYNNQL